MKKIWLPFSFLLLTIPNFNSYFCQKENFQISQFQNQNGYLYTDHEIIKEFPDPVTSSVSEPSGYLFLNEIYKQTFNFYFADQDLNLIWKESLKTKLEFDLKLLWEGQNQKGELENHLSQFLDTESFEKPLVCGTVPWKSYRYPKLEFNPLITFSWNREEKNLTLEHTIRSSLTHDQICLLTFAERNGLVKSLFKMTNLKLIYEIPPIFNQISQTELNLEFWTDVNSVQKINQLISEAVLNDSELKKLKFLEYFENPILTPQQKQLLLNINDDFQITFQILLQLTPKYQEEIFNPLLKNLYLKLTFFQLIDLNQLKLNSKLKIKPTENPWEIFLNQNLNYKFFFENYCDFQVVGNYLLIEPKPKHSNITGTLNLVIEFEENFKENLESLGLETDLGTFELENHSQILQNEDIFNRWKEYNLSTLSDEKFENYSIWLKSSDHYLISARESNSCFQGSIQVHLKKVYLNDDDDDDDQQPVPTPEPQSSSNFLKKYWWVLILGLFVMITIIWFVYKIFKDRKAR